MTAQFDLEQSIMQCWNVVDDMKVLYSNVLDATPPLTNDEIANVLIGLKKLYDMKFYNLFSTFEKYLAEKHNEKTTSTVDFPTSSF